MKTSKKRRTVKRQNRQPRTDRRLRTESLEGRILMAADMAAWSVDQQSNEQAEEKTDSAITSNETSSSETTKKPTASKQHGKKTAVSLPKELKLKLAEQSAAQSEEIAASEETREFDKAPVSGTDQERIDLEQKVDLQDLEDHKALFGDFADIFAANDALFHEVMDLGPANVFGDNIARDNLAGRFETGPDLSLEGIGFGESMAAEPVIRWQATPEWEVELIAWDKAVDYCGKAAEELDYDTATKKEAAEHQRNVDACAEAKRWLNHEIGTPANPKPTPVPKETSFWDAISEAASDVWDWICDLFDTPAPEDMQGDHPLPADLLAGLADATAQAYQDLYSLHGGSDPRNPEYDPLAGFAPQAYSRQDIEDAINLSGGEGCGQDDQGTALNPNSLRRTFTLNNTIEGGCRGPEDLY